MKTKIIYISGNEVFNIVDIRAAFDEVRNALNLDKNTVLFGVPVDTDDAGIMNKPTESVKSENIPETDEIDEKQETIIENDFIPENTIEQNIIETPSVVETPKKRGRPRKEVVEQTNENESVADTNDDEKIESENIGNNNNDEPTIPILSVLSVNENQNESDTQDINENTEQIDIIDEEIEETDIESETIENPQSDIDENDSEPDLEKLLSEMTPLAEDIRDDEKPEPQSPTDYDEDTSVDATLEQLATEFAENQDKIAPETKSTSRSKIGKLRNILPFKQSKHRDQGIGDLLEWAGIAANDEDFSVPGFFTNVASKK